MAASWTRWTPSGMQINVLESSYQHNPYPDSELCVLLAQQLGIEAHQVQVWFQNRRQKAKKRNAPPKVEVGEQKSAHEKPLPGAEGLHCKEKIGEPGSPGNGEKPASPTGAMMQPDGALGMNSLTSISGSLGALGASLAPSLAPPPTVNDLLAQSAVDRTVGLALQQARQLMYPMLTQQLTGRMGPPPPQPPSPRSGLNDRLFSLGLAQLFGRPASSSASLNRTIDKSQNKLKGIPMSRRSISIDAIEILSSKFSKSE